PGYAARAQAVDIARNDQEVLDMAQAFKLGDRKQLTQLLPQAKGSLLEPWAAYWELSIRLDQADKAEIESFLARYAGTYQEDRLRAEWLVQLGRNREWATFRAQLPLYRMADERSIQCYALWSDYLVSDADVAKQLQETWLPQREPDEACADAA
ncbi:MAG: lytic transglycosylase domain-containing protein, partial [Rhodoferax sp.]|nr:lytic transglycosylase domain-containing protein [Rhodoferax sp.]